MNSPVRAFRAVGSEPLFIRRAAGSRIEDVDGVSYIDYVLSWGPMIMGHAHPEVLAGIAEAMRDGTSFGAPTENEVRLAEEIARAYPSMEMVRMVNSGTEATMSAIRAARGFTGRDKILKFDGCYHGHADALLVKAGSGVATLGVPDSRGVPLDTAKHTIVAAYNDVEEVRRIMKRRGQHIACIIVEPVAGNMGVVAPEPGFLQGLRELADAFKTVLIFDEVMTGFRVAFGGAQALYGVRPDLTCLGKIIGGGFPVGAYGGRRDIMKGIAPSGPIYQAGTLSGNPVAVRAGLETLRLLSKPGVYKALEEKSSRLVDLLVQAAQEAGVSVTANRVGSMASLFFTRRKVVDYASAKRADTKKYAAFFTGMLKRGVYLAPSQFEALFLSAAHSERDLEMTGQAARDAMKQVRS